MSRANQEILNRNRGAIGQDAIDKLKADVSERYEHYRSKVIEKQPDMLLICLMRRLILSQAKNIIRLLKY